MHICHVSTTFIYKAGSTRRTTSIARALVEDGHTVTLIVGRDVELPETWSMSGIQVIQIEELVKYVDPAKDALAFIKLLHAFSILRPDAVHTHLAKAGILGRLAARVANVPHIFHTVHGPTFFDGQDRRFSYLYESLERMAARITDNMVFVGYELAAGYRDRSISGRGESHVVQSGRPREEIGRFDQLDPQDIAAIRRDGGSTDEDFVVVSVGRLVPSKQIDHTVRAVANLIDEGIPARLWIVGQALLEEERSYQQQLIDLVRKKGIEDSVRFLGYRADILAVISASDVLVLSSQYEGLPNVLVEAALARTPAVSYDVFGAHEVIQDGETGFVIVQGDEVALTSALHTLARSEERRHEMGQKAREAFESRYTEERMIERKRAFYEQVLSPRQ